MGRKKLPVVAKAKKIKLSKTQKQYAKMIHSIEADLAKKKVDLESVELKLVQLNEKKRILDVERQNLEGAKKNLEGILSQIPPPPQWTNFTKYVYEYHHHYHYHDQRPSPYPVYIGPWWNYYYGGGYLTIPSQSQLQWQNPTVNICDSPNIMGISSGGNLMKVTNTPAMPNSVLINGADLNGGTSFFCHTSNLTGLTGFSGLDATPIVNCSSSVLETRADAPGITFTSSGSQPMTGPVEYTHGDASIQSTVTVLQSLGFFDMGAPKVDAADMGLADLLKTAAK